MIESSPLIEPLSCVQVETPRSLDLTSIASNYYLSSSIGGKRISYWRCYSISCFITKTCYYLSTPIKLGGWLFISPHSKHLIWFLISICNSILAYCNPFDFLPMYTVVKSRVFVVWIIIFYSFNVF